MERNSHALLYARMGVVMLVLLLLGNIGRAQLSFSVAYTHLRQPELDQVFQLYNTSRPWHTQALKPLTHGVELTGGWNFCLHKRRQLHLLPQLVYNYSMTTALNNNQRIITGIQRLDGALAFRFHPKALIKGVHQSGPLGPRWFITITPGYSWLWPFIRVNGEALQEDDGAYHPRSFVFNCGVGIGYHALMLKETLIFTPEILATWVPYFELKDYVQSINGHNVLAMNNTFDNGVVFQLRLRITILKKKVNWWDRPARGGE